MLKSRRETDVQICTPPFAQCQSGALGGCISKWDLRAFLSNCGSNRMFCLVHSNIPCFIDVNDFSVEDVNIVPVWKKMTSTDI